MERLKISLPDDLRSAIKTRVTDGMSEAETIRRLIQAGIKSQSVNMSDESAQAILELADQIADLKDELQKTKREQALIARAALRLTACNFWFSRTVFPRDQFNQQKYRDGVQQIIEDALQVSQNMEDDER